MSFRNKLIERRRVTIDFSDDKVLTEQHHKESCDVNCIVRKFGLNHISQFAEQYSDELINAPIFDLQDHMNLTIRAKQAFEKLPSGIRSRFSNDPVKFLTFFNDPANAEELDKLGLIKIRRPAPADLDPQQPEAEPAA